MLSVMQSTDGSVGASRHWGSSLSAMTNSSPARCWMTCAHAWMQACIRWNDAEEPHSLGRTCPCIAQLENVYALPGVPCAQEPRKENSARACRSPREQNRKMNIIRLVMIGAS